MSTASKEVESKISQSRTTGVPYESISYNPDNEQEWHDLRATGIGGSDAGTIAGLNPYKTQHELYLEKRGELEREDLSDNQAVHFGNVLEDIVAQEYARRQGKKVRRNNQMLRSKANPFMLANLDREIVGEPRILECKTAGAYIKSEQWGSGNTYETLETGEVVAVQESDEVPEHYLLQCQHYMAVTGKDSTDLAVLVGGRDYRCYTIHRNDFLIQNLIELEAEFWQRVQDGNPPAIDYEASSTGKLLGRMYPGTNGESIILTDDYAHWHQVKLDATKRAGEYEKVKEIANNHLKEAAGNSSKVFIAGLEGGYTRKTIKRKGFEVAPTEYMDFRFSAKTTA